MNVCRLCGDPAGVASELLTGALVYECADDKDQTEVLARLIAERSTDDLALLDHIYRVALDAIRRANR